MLYAGSFNGQHDLTTLLEAARQLRSVPDVAFLLIGAGPLEQQLARTAKSWGLENVFFYPGVPVSELSLYLGAADVGALDGGCRFQGQHPLQDLPLHGGSAAGRRHR